MKRLIALTVLATLAVAPMALAQEAAPKMVVPKIVHDFGEVFETDKYECTFIVRNQGNADLLVEDVRPGCGCTAAHFDKVIPPGKEGKIQLVLDGTKVHDNFSKSATVTTNDPEQPKITLTMQGVEVTYVSVAPAGRIYLQGMYGESVGKSLTVTSNEKDLKEFRVTGVTSNIDDKITYRFEEGAMSGEYEVHIYKNPKLPTLNTFGTLFIHTNSEKSPEQQVQVQVVTKGSIAVQPSVVNFGRVEFGHNGDSGASLTRSFEMIKTQGAFEVGDISVDNAHYRWDLEEVVPGQRYRVNVTFDAPEQTKPRQNEFGELTIHTSDPTEPMVRVRLIARAE